MKKNTNHKSFKNKLVVWAMLFSIITGTVVSPASAIAETLDNANATKSSAVVGAKEEQQQKEETASSVTEDSKVEKTDSSEAIEDQISNSESYNANDSPKEEEKTQSTEEVDQEKEVDSTKIGELANRPFPDKYDTSGLSDKEIEALGLVIFGETNELEAEITMLNDKGEKVQIPFKETPRRMMARASGVSSSTRFDMSYNMTGFGVDASYGYMAHHWVGSVYAYCVEPMVTFQNDRTYTSKNMNLSNAQWKQVNSVMNYGAKNSANSVLTGYTQLMVWESLGWKVSGVGLIGNTADYNKFKTDTQAKIDLFNKKASFNGQTVTLRKGESIVLTDSNNSVNDMTINSNNTGATVTKSGNKVTITANASSNPNGTIIMGKKSPVAGTALVWDEPGKAQEVASAGAMDPSANLTTVRVVVIQEGDFKLTKTDENNQPMQGAVFEIKVGNGEVEEYTTDAKGNIDIKGLEEGTVVSYEEVDTVEGYYIDTKTSKGQITIEGNKVNGITVVNPRAYASFTTTKLDAETGAKPQGDATLNDVAVTLFDKDMVKIKEVKSTDSTVTFDKLTIGKYFYQETQAPTGYNLENPVYAVEVTQVSKTSPTLHVKITDVDGKVLSESDGNGETNLHNTVIRGNVAILKSSDGDWKSDLKAQVFLEGATFGLFNSNDEKVDEQISDAKGQLEFKNHPFGDYTVKELKAPEGYSIIAKDIKVSVAKNQQTYTFNVLNEVKGGFIRVVKQDDETHKPIFNGAQFKIKNLQTGKYKTTFVDSKETEIWTTNAEGFFQSASTFLYGEYELEEVKAPFGYTLSNQKVKFKVDGDNKETVIPLAYENARVKGTLTLEKRGQFATSTEDKDAPVYPLVNQELTEDFEVHQNEAQEKREEYTDEQNKKISEAEAKYGKAVDLKPTMELGITSTYGIFAREQIKLQEGTIVAEKDARIGTIKTDKNGKGQFKNLEIGSYYLVEEEAQDGFLINTKPINFEITYKDQNTAVVGTTALATDDYHRVSVQLHKAQEVVTDVDAENDTDDNAKRKEAEELSNQIHGGGEVKPEPTEPSEPEAPTPMLANETEAEKEEETTEPNVEIPVNNARKNALLDYDPVRGHGTPVKELEKGQGQVFGLFADEDIINHATGKVLVKKDTPLGYSIVKDGIASWNNLFLPAGNYYSKEVVQSTNYKPYDTVHKFTLDDKGNYKEYKVTITKDSTDIKYDEGNFVAFNLENAIKNEVEDIEIQTVLTEELGTQIWYTAGRITGFDLVSYKNLKVDGTPYTQEAQLVYEDGQPIVDITGQPVISSVTFVPTSPNGIIAVPFNFEAPDAIRNQRVVAFEDLYEGQEKRKVAVHHDLYDVDQFGRFLDPTIGTQATNKDGKKFINPSKAQTLYDDVKIDDVYVGGNYKLVAKFVEFGTGEQLLEQPLEFEEEFVAESSNFIHRMETEFDASNLNGKKGVFLEYLYFLNPNTKEWVEVAKHEDVNDDKQAIQIVEPKIHTELFFLDPTLEETNVIDPLAKVKGYDRVYFENLIKGEEYTIDLDLMDKETEKVHLMPDGTESRGTLTFIAGEDGEIEKVINAYDFYNNKDVEENTDKEPEAKEEETVEKSPEAKEDSEQIKVKSKAKAETSDTNVKEEETEVEEEDPTEGMTELEKDQYAKSSRLQENRKDTPYEDIVDVELVTGHIDVPFETDFSASKGKTVVAFETLSHNDTPVTEEKDYENEKQTGKIRNPEIGTTALVNGKKEITSNGTLVLEDEVAYKDLTVGVEYEQEVTWMVKAKNDVLNLNGTPVTAKVKFTPTESNGKVVVKTEIQASDLFAKYGSSVDLVAFEKTTRDSNPIAEHEDINDKGQTVKVKQPTRDVPKTGASSSSNTLLYLTLMLVVTISAVVLYFYNKKNKLA